MSQQEFDNYLAFVGRLLRFDAKQREAVAEEFRAHLEDRLDDLIQRGHDRDQAVRMAIEEFGDAAGLAAQLVNISRNRRRRWIMRCTTATIGGLAALAIMAMAFWPETNNGPAPARVIAQGPDKAADKKAAEDPFADRQPGPAEVFDKLQSKSGDGDSMLGFKKPASAAKSATIEQKLARPTTVDFDDTPLRDVLAYLADTSDVQFYVKKKSLEDAGANEDVAVTLSLRDVRLGTVLELVLEQAGLTYVDREELIVITTVEDADTTMEVRVYDCRDLLAMNPGKGASARRSAGMPAMQGAGGGGGGLFSVPDESSPAGTRLPAEILPQFGGAAPPSATPPSAVPGGPPQQSPGADSMPGAGTAAPARGTRGGGGGGGGFGGGGGGGMGMGGMGGGYGGDVMGPLSDEDALIGLLTATVEPQSWDEVGGDGSLAMYNGLLVVRQTPKTHQKVERVLNMLRESAGLDPKTVKVTK